MGTIDNDSINNKTSNESLLTKAINWKSSGEEIEIIEIHDSYKVKIL